MDPNLNSESLSIFFPCYNDRETIGPLIRNADRVAREWTSDYELLVIDDGSSDGSREILNDLTHQFPRLRNIFHESNQGYGAALRTGFSQASKNLIFYTDGDGQYDVSELKTFLSLWSREVDLMNGYKIKRFDPWYRKVLGKLYGTLAKFFFQIRIRDVNCDYRLLRRHVLDQIRLESKSGAIGLELVKKTQLAGFSITERPVHHYPRVHGRSEFLKPKKIIETVFDLFRLRCKIKP